MLLPNSCSRLLLGKHVLSIFQRYYNNRLIDNNISSRYHPIQTQKRTLFKISKRPRNIEFSKKQMVGFSVEQMFDVVSDVDHYYKFLPLCTKSTVTTRNPEAINAILVIGYPPISDCYVANMTLVNPNVVKAECVEGKFFSNLISLWRFSPGLKEEEQSCIIDFEMSLKFNSVLQSQLTTLFFDQFIRQMEGAFMKEVDKRYGPATMQPKRLLRDTFIKD